MYRCCARAASTKSAFKDRTVGGGERLDLRWHAKQIAVAAVPITLFTGYLYSLRLDLREELATLLRIPRGYKEEWLRRDVRTLPPPAIYEHAGSAQLARLFGQGWFHAVLVFFWFWHE